MFDLFKKKVIFETNIRGLEKVMPIIQAKDYKHPWVGKALDELSRIRKQPNYGMEKIDHTARCPAIFKVQRQGWILRTWQDIVIETNGDGENFNWNTPMNQKELNGIDYITSHSKFQMHQYMENWPQNTLSTVIKINTGWTCRVPKGYYLLEMPVSHVDENRFTVMPGFFSKDMGAPQMNVRIQWHVLNGKILIKAGTPLSQYILVPKKQFAYEMRSMLGDTNIHDVISLVTNHRFVKNYKEMRDLLGNFE